MANLSCAYYGKSRFKDCKREHGSEAVEKKVQLYVSMQKYDDAEYAYIYIYTVYKNICYVHLLLGKLAASKNPTKEAMVIFRR